MQKKTKVVLLPVFKSFMDPLIINYTLIEANI